jgi:hypothetical protein
MLQLLARQECSGQASLLSKQMSAMEPLSQPLSIREPNSNGERRHPSPPKHEVEEEKCVLPSQRTRFVQIKEGGH